MPKAKVTLSSLNDRMNAQDRKLDTLIEMFQQMNAEMIARSNEADSKFDKMDARLDQGYSRFDRLDARFDKMDVRFDKLEARFDHLSDQLQQQQQQIQDLQERIEVLHGLMENLLVRVERLEQEYTMITAALKRLEIRFDSLEALRLKERVEALEKRVTALESIEN